MRYAYHVLLNACTMPTHFFLDIASDMAHVLFTLITQLNVDE